jgi:hypothetical protein
VRIRARNGCLYKDPLLGLMDEGGEFVAVVNCGKSELVVRTYSGLDEGVREENVRRILEKYGVGELDNKKERKVRYYFFGNKIETGQAWRIRLKRPIDEELIINPNVMLR